MSGHRIKPPSKGPRVSSGRDSKQDYGTPDAFLRAVEKHFGPIAFDLAAHAGNHKHARYFAPAVFVEKVERGETDLAALIDDLATRGADPDEARALAFEQWATITGRGELRIPNRDRGAVALDSFAQDWSAIAPADGVLFNNCEFADIGPWAAKHAAEAQRGANSVLLTPAVFANWYRDNVAGVADVYELSGRLCFDGKNVFPKDCRLSHFWPGATGKVCLWDWREDRILNEWEPARVALTGAEVGAMAVAYMRDSMAMPHAFDGENTDQGQNQLLGHMHTFALKVLRGRAGSP